MFRERIEDLPFNHGLAQRIRCQSAGEGTAGKNAGEVAVAIGLNRHSARLIGNARVLFKDLHIEEEERAVLAVIDLRDRHLAADATTEIVAAVAIQNVAEGLARVQRFVDEVVVRRSMVRVAARTSRELEQAGTGLSKFRRVVRRLNRDFFQRLNAGLYLLLRCRSIHAVRDILSVELDAVRVCRRTVHTHRLGRVKKYARGQQRGCQRIADACGTGRVHADS